MSLRRTVPFLVMAVALVATGTVAAPTADIPMENNAYIGSEACLDCHEIAELHMDYNIHMRIESFEVLGREVGCEGCHGPGKLHMEESDPKMIRSFAEREGLGGQVCMECHNPHNNREFMLKTRMGKADLCYTCHQAIEGPWVFEHAPVEEDCSICHTPHGSVANNLLVANEPTLCLQCHDFHFHAGYRASDDHEVDVGGIERENPFGPQGMNIAFTTNCTSCHAHIHGSDTPSQTTTSGGRGLIP